MKPLLLLAALTAAVVGAAQDAEDRSQVRAQAEAKVTADLARRQDTAPEAIRVVKTIERSWPDERLGCGGDRRIVGDPVPVAGYQIVLELADRRYVYHADRVGRFVACDRPPKPLGPIR